MAQTQITPTIAIACGGTGGHLFPGIAVAEEFQQRGCDVILLVSQKEVDQRAVKSLRDVEVVTIPAVGLTGRNVWQFFQGLRRSFRASRRAFKRRRPAAFLSMGGFTSAAPAIAAKFCGAKIFLHDSNSIPGRANRWLAHIADQGFVYFQEAQGRLYLQKISTTGMPLRHEFLDEIDRGAARVVFGLDPDKPVLLVMGGSQGATGINDLLIQALPEIQKRSPDLQFIHLTGPTDVERVRTAYEAARVKAVVHPFLTEMELAMGAATLAISRSGASSLAEIAAMKLPTILIPYPHAADNHQYYNAIGFVESGAAKMFEQASLTPERLAQEINIIEKELPTQHTMKEALSRWHDAGAARRIVDAILMSIGVETASSGTQAGDCCGGKLNLEKAHV